MKLSDDVFEMLDEAYIVGDTAEELVQATGCQPWQVHRFLSYRLLMDGITELREQGSSIRQIAIRLGTSRWTVYRLLDGWKWR